MVMTRKTDFMKWIDHQVDADADLKRKVDEYLNEMIIEQKTRGTAYAARHARRHSSPSGLA